MLTGIGESFNELTSPLYGADAYIDKPFEFAELEARIRETLERRRAGTLGRPDGGSDEDEDEEAAAAKSDEDEEEAESDDDEDEDREDEPVTQRFSKGKKKAAKPVFDSADEDEEGADEDEA